MSAKSRVFSLVGAVVLVATLACADTSITAPTPDGAKAARDTTTGFLGDTVNCRSGWQVIGGRVVCD
jgi:hypothetical protein